MNIQKLIWALEELSDREIQESVWLGNSEGEISSFVEAYSRTFDDTGLAILLDKGGESDQLTPDIVEKANMLDALLKRIPQSLSEIEIIDHPAMRKARIAAAEMLALLKK
jgi:hypothetical protein